MSLPFLLLIDDAPEMGDIVSYVGKRAGIEVVACRDAPSAWELLQTRRPDLLLVDVNLPGVSGPELCRRVRSTPDLSKLAIALFSTWGLPADIAAGLEAGADYVVSKELVAHPLDLRQRLEEVLADSAGRGLTSRVTWQGGAAGAAMPADWPEALNGILRGSALRRIGPEVLRVVVRRAFEQAQTAPVSQNTVAQCLTPDGFLVSCPVLSAALDSQAVVKLIVSLVGQLGRLLGAEASRPVREALAGVVPGMTGLSSQ
jgi:DNA-binding response OmpR family regulator